MNSRQIALAVSVLAIFQATAHANYHLMQIEQFIGGVGGNTSAQAIQLRMRSANQNVVSNGRIRAWDAAGANPILLIDMTTNVSGTTSGSNVLLTSAAFNSLMSSVPGYATDFTLASTIPLSYLSGGKITFEDNSGATIWWSLAFGAYTGTTSANTGSTTNTTGSTGNFGSPASAPITSSRQGIRFTGLATATSAGNSLDYAATSDPATVRNNGGTSFTVVPEPGTLALLAVFGFGAYALARRRA
jgi:hypothetical protein